MQSTVESARPSQKLMETSLEFLKDLKERLKPLPDRIRAFEEFQKYQNIFLDPTEKPENFAIEAIRKYRQFVDNQVMLERELDETDQARARATRRSFRSLMQFSLYFHLCLPEDVFVRSDDGEDTRECILPPAIDTSNISDEGLLGYDYASVSFSTPNTTVGRHPELYRHYNYVDKSEHDGLSEGKVESDRLSEDYFMEGLIPVLEKISSFEAEQFYCEGRLHPQFSFKQPRLECGIEAIFSKAIVEPVAILLTKASSSPQGTGNVFGAGLVNQWNLKMDSSQYIVKGDLSITMNDKPLVVIEVKYPSLGGSMFKNDHYFIQVLTQTTHQCVAAGTPFAAFSDSEFAYFFQILVDDPFNTREHLSSYYFGTTVKGKIQKNDKKKTGRDLRPTDRRVGIKMRFRRVHKRDKVSIFATLAAFAYEASLMLATDEARAEIKTKLVSLLEKCKLTKDDELFRKEADDVSLKKRTESIVKKVEDKRPKATDQQRKMSKSLMSKDFAFKIKEWEPLSVSDERHIRNAQVYRLKKDVIGKLMLPGKWNKSSVILKVYDPKKSPAGWGKNSFSWRTKVKIALHSAERELWAYCRLRGCLVAPEFIQTGFLKGEDISGPYLLLQDISGKKPNMGSLKDVQKILESCSELLKRQIVHGDIKADNVLLCNGSAILFDFGISIIRMTDDEVAQKSLDELLDDSAELKSKWKKDVRMATAELAHGDRITLTSKFETCYDEAVELQPVRENKVGQSSKLSPNKKRKSL